MKSKLKKISLAAILFLVAALCFGIFFLSNGNTAVRADEQSLVVEAKMAEVLPDNIAGTADHLKTGYRVGGIGMNGTQGINAELQGVHTLNVDGADRNFLYYHGGPTNQWANLLWQCGIDARSDNKLDLTSVNADGNGALQFYLYFAGDYHSAHFFVGTRSDQYFEAGWAAFAKFNLGQDGVGKVLSGGNWYKITLRMDEFALNGAANVNDVFNQIMMFGLRFHHWADMSANKYLLSDIVAVNVGAEESSFEVLSDAPAVDLPDFSAGEEQLLVAASSEGYVADSATQRYPFLTPTPINNTQGLRRFNVDGEMRDFAYAANTAAGAVNMFWLSDAENLNDNDYSNENTLDLAQYNADGNAAITFYAYMEGSDNYWDGGLIMSSRTDTEYKSTFAHYVNTNLSWSYQFDTGGLKLKNGVWQKYTYRLSDLVVNTGNPALTAEDILSNINLLNLYVGDSCTKLFISDIYITKSLSTKVEAVAGDVPDVAAPAVSETVADKAQVGVSLPIPVSVQETDYDVTVRILEGGGSLLDTLTATEETIASLAYKFAEAGVYDLQITVRDASLNENTVSAQVSVYTDPVITVGSVPTNIQLNVPYDFTDLFTASDAVDGDITPSLSFVIRDEGGEQVAAIAAETADKSYTFTAMGNYTVTASVANAFPLTAETDPVSLVVADLPTVTLGTVPEFAVAGQPFAFDFFTAKDSAGTDITDDIVIQIYSGGTLAATVAADAEKVYTFAEGGHYELVASVTDKNGLKSYEVRTDLAVAAPAEITVGTVPSELKRGSTIDFASFITAVDALDDDISEDIAVEISLGGETLATIAADAAEKTYVFPSHGSYTVRITVVNSAKITAEKEFTLEVGKVLAAPPVVSLTSVNGAALQESYSVGTQIVLSISAVDFANQSVSYTVTVTGPDGASVSVSDNSTFTVSAAGDYTVTVVAVDADQNQTTQTFTIHTAESGGCSSSAAGIASAGAALLLACVAAAAVAFKGCKREER